MDTKKKELVGDFKNGGREWAPKGTPEAVRVHDFIIPELGRVSPYGIYDLAANAGWVNVGIDHDTAAFAVASSRRWWWEAGQVRYPSAPRLLIDPNRGSDDPTLIMRISDGLLFEIGAWPWVDGRTYVWKPKGGLFLRATTSFAPKAGTRMRELFAPGNASGRLNNEQFYEALRKATTALELNFASATEAFWFSWNAPYREGDYVVLETCARPGKKDECTGDFVGKAVYEQRTDRVFFAFTTVAAPPECKAGNGRDPYDAALRGVQFFPPRVRWQPAALAVLTTLYCPRIR